MENKESLEKRDRDGFIFYQSFYKSIEKLPKINRHELYEAIIKYSFDLEEPKLKGVSEVVWILIKPQLEANNRRYENGKKPKQNRSKTEANGKQNESESEAKEKEKEKEKEKDKTTTKSEIEIFYETSKKIPVDQRNVTQHMVVCFCDLGYTGKRDETVDQLREWIRGVCELKGKTTTEIIDTISTWYAYHSEQKEPVKNFKASLLNHYSLNPKKNGK